MKLCSKCNLSYDDEKMFCKKCGNQLTLENQLNPKEVAIKTVLEERLKANPLNLEILHEYAQFLFNNLLFKEAITVALKILAITEKDIAAKELIFKSYIKLKLYKDALEIGEELLVVKATDIYLLEELASIAKELGKSEEAIVYYDKIISIKSTHSNALYNKALILLEKNQIENGIEIFKSIYKADGQNDRITSIYVGIDRALNGDFKSAKDIFIPVLSSSDISNYNLHNNRGILFLVYSLSQNKEDGLEIYKMMSNIDFDLLNENYHIQEEQAIAKTLLYLSELIYKKEFHDEITKDIEYLKNTYLNKLNFTENTTQIISEIWYILGLKLFEIKLFKDSLGILAKALKLLPDDSKYKEKYDEVNKLINMQSQRKKRKNIIIISVVLVSIIVAGISIIYYNNYKENAAWESAKKANTYSSFQDYLKLYPNGKYSENALVLEDETLWKELSAIQDYDTYINVLPNGKHIKEAQNKREDALWIHSKQTNNLSYYLRQYPNGKYVKQVKVYIPSLDKIISSDDKIYILLYEVDDIGECKINDNIVLTVNYGQTSEWFELTPYLKNDMNILELVGTNKSGCCYFTFNVKLKVNNTVIWEDKMNKETSDEGVFYNKKISLIRLIK